MVKRAKLDLKIILRESDESAKFELFQRINTGGAPLSDQEIRNAMLVAASRPFFEWLQRLSKYPAFVDCTPLSDRSYDERYDMELVLRFIVLRTVDDATLAKVGDIADFLTDHLMRIASNFDAIRQNEENAFKRTFDCLSDRMGADSFRRYDAQRKKFAGGFLISAFEFVALGLGFHASKSLNVEADDLAKRIRNLWSNEEFTNSSGAGIRASTRIPKVVALGRELFQP